MNIITFISKSEAISIYILQTITLESYKNVNYSTQLDK